VNRVAKVMKICRQYLDHIQNSVFEGEISSSNFKDLEFYLTQTIDKNSDSIIIYKLWKKNFKRKIIGVEKRDSSNFI
jgi:CRISPR-associated protein Cas2